MFVLSSDISIGKYRFTQVVDVVIESSSRQLSDTAVIDLPLSAVLENTERLTLEKEIQRGDKVTIKLGYNDNPNTEFKGYVTSLTAEKTLKVNCEDEMYSLRKPVENKAFKNTTLKDIVSYLNTTLSADIPDINIDAFVIKNMTGVQVLEKLKKDYGLTVFFDENQKLYVGLAYAYKLDTVKYNLALNVVQSDLKFKRADEIKLKVKAVSIQKDNSRIEVETGDADGELRTLYFRGISSKTELEKLANEEILKYKYDGYEGKLTAFGLPVAKVGTVALIVDETYPQREGTYYVESVKITFGQNGFRRNVELGVKL